VDAEIEQAARTLAEQAGSPMRVILFGSQARGALLAPPTDEQRTMLLEGLAESFMKPETAGIDWDLLRDGKLRAWPIR